MSVFLSRFKLTLLCLLLFFSFSAFAWDSMGHRIIAEIAYEHLDNKAKESTNSLIEYLADAYPYDSSMQTASAWADYIKEDDVHTFDNWHYINNPVTYNDTSTQSANTINLVWALNQSIETLNSPKSNQYEKAFFLRFLLHLTGDASQPLHCADLYSQSFPNGDEGGNLFLTQNGSYSNLHATWDDGLGLFQSECNFSLSKSKLAKCIAAKIQLDYPERDFGNKANDLNPQDWANESYQIAKTFAYRTPEKKPLSDTYIKQGQTIVEQQLALSGYRLANLLNSIFG